MLVEWWDGGAATTAAGGFGGAATTAAASAASGAGTHGADSCTGRRERRRTGEGWGGGR